MCSQAPMRKASSAGTLRPVRMISIARPMPTMRGRRTVPPSTSGAPAPAVDAEIRRTLHHAHVAPEREFEAAGDRGPRHRGDDRLVELEAGRAERSARDGLAV